MPSKPAGWKRDSARHSLAARGVSTSVVGATSPYLKAHPHGNYDYRSPRERMIDRGEMLRNKLKEVLVKSMAEEDAQKFLDLLDDYVENHDEIKEARDSDMRDQD